MIGLALLPLAGVVGAVTWWAYWRQLRKLPAVTARYPRCAAPREVTLTAVFPEESAIMIAFQHTRRGVDRRTALLDSFTARCLVVEQADEGMIVEQLERWCATTAALVYSEDRTIQQATLRDVASGIRIALNVMSQTAGDQL